MATSIPGLFFSSRLFFVVDRVTDIRFLVDTEAEVNVIPPSPADCVRQLDGLVLQAAIDSIINTFGTCSHTFKRLWTATSLSLAFYCSCS